MDLDFESFVILGLLLLVPALVVFIILTVIRLRRGKLHPRRITKQSSGRGEA
ncbi:MAG TPA: hypothetical protein VGC39_02025 [Candidatus Methylacidiphilales bacterium]